MNLRYDRNNMLNDIIVLCEKIISLFKDAKKLSSEGNLSNRINRIISICNVISGKANCQKIENDVISKISFTFDKHSREIYNIIASLSNIVYKKNKTVFAVRAEELHYSSNKNIHELLHAKEKNSNYVFQSVLTANFAQELKPINLTIELTSECNFRCAMCHQSSSSTVYSHNSISLETLQKMLICFKAARVVALQLSGEPTLSPYFDVVCKAGYASAVELSLITNGSLLHTKLSVLGALSSITVSFDGACRDTFERQRRGADFEQILKNIRELRAAYPAIPVRFNCCVSRLNLSDLPEIIRIAHELKIQSVTFTLIALTSIETASGNRSAAGDQLAFSGNDFGKLQKQIDKAREIARELKVNLNAPFLDRKLMPFYLANGTFLSSDKASTLVPNAQLMQFLDENDRKRAERSFSGLLERLDTILLQFDDLMKEYEEPLLPYRPSARSLDFISSNDDVPSLEKIIDYDRSISGPLNIPYCMSVYTTLLVMANGEAALCCRSIGKEVLSAERLATIRTAFLDPNPTDASFDYCRKCNLSQRYLLLADYLRHCRRQGATWDQFVFPVEFRPHPGAQAQLDRLRRTIFDPAHSYLPLGKSLTFGQNGTAEPYCMTGFDEMASASSRWSSAMESVFGFQLHCPGRNLALSLKVTPFISAQHCPVQEFDLFLNTSKIATMRLDSPQATDLTIVIPATAFTSARDYYELRLLYRNATQPGRVGLSPCFLPRALLFHTVTVS